ncbi:MAG: hypothetical protein ABIM54_00930 [candidate division WOR-3 bacterium]
MKKKICPICKKEIRPPEIFWLSVNACSACVRKVAEEIQREKLTKKDNKIEKHETKI